MPTTGFHSEWITIGEHRVLLECRASFPNENMRFIADVAVVACNNNTMGRARVVRIFYDDKACIWTVAVASTSPEDESLEETLRTIFHNIYDDGNVQPQVTIVEEGATDSDHYNQTEHLSVIADIAADRWRHSDAEYQKSVSNPR